MSVTEWPKQDTGLFAVPTCVQCCTLPPAAHKYEVRVDELGEYFWCGGNVGFDGSNDTLYRTATWGGTINTDYSNDGDCASVEASESCEYSGSSTISYGYFAPGDPAACSGELIGSYSGGLFADGNAWNPSLADPIGAGGITGSNTGTVETLEGTGECVGTGGGTFDHAKSTGTATATLSNPFTEEAAIAWRDANYPGRGDWFEVDPTSKTWSSTYQPMVGPFVALSNYNAIHMTVEFRITRGGYTPGHAYDCSVKLYRATWNEEDWAEYATLEDTLTADVDGNLVFTGTAPIARGYRTWPDNSSFTATPA